MQQAPNKSNPVVKTSVKKVNLVMGWNFTGDPRDDHANNDCKLCKRPLVAPPLQELQSDPANPSKGIVIEGKLAKGVCGDIFHEKCIANSLSSGCVSCPTCARPWSQARILRSSVVCGNIENLTMKRKSAYATA